MKVKVVRSAEEGESPTGEVEMFTFTVEGANFPAIGDRLVWEYAAMQVVARTWYIEMPGSATLWVELE